MYIYLQHKLIPDEQALISIYEHGYLYGVGLFETFRTYHGVPFLLAEHLDRLTRSCEQIGMQWEAQEERLRNQITTLLKKNKLNDGYFRFNVSAGVHPIGLPNREYEQVTEALFVKELPANLSSTIKLHTVPLRRNTPEGDVRFKSHHYLNNLLAKKEVPPNTEGIFLTKYNKVAEGIVSNLFFIKKGTLYTPSVTTGILPGITREWVLRTARLLSWVVFEGEYDLSFAQEADEVFITNSIRGIVPVSEWDGFTYHTNPLTKNQTSMTHLLQNNYQRCIDESLSSFNQ